MTPVLKPCPHCGGVAELDSRQAYRSVRGALGTRVVVYCVACDAEVGCCMEDGGMSRDDMVDCIVCAWNLRYDSGGNTQDA